MALTTDIIATAILHKIDPALDLVEKAADQAQGVVSDTRTVADWMYRMGEDTRDELQKGMDMEKEDIQRAMECIKDEVSKLNRKVVLATNNMGGMENHQ